jgi:lipoate---protein ligase
MRSACLVQARRIPASWVRQFVTSTRTSSDEYSPTPTTSPKPLNESEPGLRPPRSGPSYRKLELDSGSIAKPRRPKPISVARVASLPASELESVLKDPSLKHQIYISHHHDPYTNLSIEHYLLQNSHADSRILFLYSNSRSVVIGRNQNPWLEANLDKAYGATHAKFGHRTTETQISFVRRRSGGGTVYHDPGNLNYSIICPPAEFTRDKHAVMVASALRSLGVKGARVNERHDIVVDRSGRTDHTVKVSGSAYKLTRQRALHHGTLLLNADLSDAKKYLRSPALEYIKARGVESVRSLIGNVASDVNPKVALHIRELAKVEIIREFASLYNLKLPSRHLNLEYVGHSYRKQCLHVGDGWAMGYHFPEGWLPIAEPEFMRGLKELRVIPSCAS